MYYEDAPVNYFVSVGSPIIVVSFSDPTSYEERVRVGTLVPINSWFSKLSNHDFFLHKFILEHV